MEYTVCFGAKLEIRVKARNIDGAKDKAEHLLELVPIDDKINATIDTAFKKNAHVLGHDYSTSEPFLIIDMQGREYQV
jgi:hypothetical protein